MASKIYTKTGDKGKTSLIGGTKVPKSNIRIESYGTVDELNAFIGLLNDQIAALWRVAPSDPPDSAASPATLAPVMSILREVQDRLFTIGSSLACDPDKAPQFKIPDLAPSDVHLLEKKIDEMNAELPPLKSFLLPGGHIAVSTAHIARCVCRRAERLCVSMQENGFFIEPLLLQYLNRLSDYLFMLSRWIGHMLNIPEIPWKPRV
jgi:cob(I)alamin adenosyltransferase